MKYCYSCNRVTPGDPLFCNFCGRSYNARFCPHKHRNPRGASVCSECGSRDLSTPQPKVPFWAPVLGFVLSCVPGVLLALATLIVLAAILADIRQNPLHIFLPLMLLGVLWWMWSLIPKWLREAIHRMLKRRRDGDGRGRNA